MSTTSTNLYAIGFWKDSETSKYPKPKVKAVPMERHIEIAEHLEKGTVAQSYRGISSCRVCGCMNGSTDMVTRHFVYPAGLSHYIREHNVHLPEWATKLLLEEIDGKIANLTTEEIKNQTWIVSPKRWIEEQ